MLNVYIRETRTVQLTHLAIAFANTLESSKPPIFTDYQLYLVFRGLYKNPEGLHLRNKTPTLKSYRRARNLLIDANKLARDPDYPKAFRILSKQDLPADEVCSLVDPFCYISHLSAMQRYGLTDRRPEALHLTTPSKEIAANLIENKMSQDYEHNIDSYPEDQMLYLTTTNHPESVRKRRLHINKTIHYGEHQQIRNSFARISTIGQTFLDMLNEPTLCGGMAHIKEVWREHADKYIEDIISAVEKAPRAIHKVRAGYILDEVLKIKRSEIHGWLKFAQRGSSQRLDPTKPFINNYSEKWMLSLNV